MTTGTFFLLRSIAVVLLVSTTNCGKIDHVRKLKTRIEDHTSIAVVPFRTTFPKKQAGGEFDADFAKQEQIGKYVQQKVSSNLLSSGAPMNVMILPNDVVNNRLAAYGISYVDAINMSNEQLADTLGVSAVVRGEVKFSDVTITTPSRVAPSDQYNPVDMKTGGRAYDDLNGRIGGDLASYGVYKVVVQIMDGSSDEALWSYKLGAAENKKAKKRDALGVKLQNMAEVFPYRRKRTREDDEYFY